MATPCKTDCEYYSKYTQTCDYTLLMFKSRGCPTSACTVYAPRTTRRSWSIFRNIAEKREFCEEKKSMKTPDVPDCTETRYVYADCGHEVYDGEYLYEWDDSRTLCPECVELKFDELSIEEKTALMGCQGTEVTFPCHGDSL